MKVLIQLTLHFHTSFQLPLCIDICRQGYTQHNYSIIINRLVKAGIRNEIVIAYCIHIGRCQRVKKRGKPILFRLFHFSTAPRRANNQLSPIRRFQCMRNAFKLFWEKPCTGVAKCNWRLLARLQRGRGRRHRADVDTRFISSRRQSSWMTFLLLYSNNDFLVAAKNFFHSVFL